MTTPATMLRALSAVALLLALAGCRTGYPIDLGCDCDDLSIGYGIDGFYDSRETCEEKSDRDALYARMLSLSERFCARWYRCVDPDCPAKRVDAPGAAAACRCIEIAAGAHQGEWTLECDLTRGDTECCCVPST